MSTKFMFEKAHLMNNGEQNLLQKMFSYLLKKSNVNRESLDAIELPGLEDIFYKSLYEAQYNILLDETEAQYIERVRAELEELKSRELRKQCNEVENQLIITNFYIQAMQYPDQKEKLFYSYLMQLIDLNPNLQKSNFFFSPFRQTIETIKETAPIEIREEIEKLENRLNDIPRNPIEELENIAGEKATEFTKLKIEIEKLPPLFLPEAVKKDLRFSQTLLPIRACDAGNQKAINIANILNIANIQMDYLETAFKNLITEKYQGRAQAADLKCSFFSCRNELDNNILKAKIDELKLKYLKALSKLVYADHNYTENEQKAILALLEKAQRSNLLNAHTHHAWYGRLGHTESHNQVEAFMRTMHRSR